MPIARPQHVYGQAGASAARALMQARGMQVPNPRGEATAGAALFAYVNHGRWVVECDACHSAQVADPDEPRFFCVRCFNASAGGQWRPVGFPAGAAAIEAVLEARPDAANRNWWPGEELAQLQGENQAHGLPTEVSPD
jgi:hypothetical protein